MAFSIYNQNLDRVGEVGAVISSTWEECYCDKGTCQLAVADVGALSPLLIPGNFIGQNGKITSWQITAIEKRDGILTATGFTPNYTILNQRIYDGTYMSGAVAAGLRAVVMDKRPASVVDLYTARPELIDEVESEHSFVTLFKLAKTLCEGVDYGFRFIHDKGTKRMLFDVYKGSSVANAKLSPAYGNIRDVVIERCETDYFNVAYVGGEGEGSARRFVWAGDTATTGLVRHELWVDAKDLKRENRSEADYDALLVERGLQKLNEKNARFEVTFEVNPKDFGTTYGLGDTVTCVIHDDGLKLTVRVNSFKEVIEADRQTLTLSIGEPILKSF